MGKAEAKELEAEIEKLMTERDEERGKLLRKVQTDRVLRRRLRLACLKARHENYVRRNGAETKAEDALA